MNYVAQVLVRFALAVHRRTRFGRVALIWLLIVSMIVPSLPTTPLLAAPTAQSIPAISPVLECVAVSGSTIKAYYGYNNSSTTVTNLAVGSNNFFIPSPQDRGQPTRFLPGREVAVFTTTFSGGSITWSLTGRTATAGSTNTACTARRLDSQPPTAPSNLQVSTQSSTSITLNWNASTDNFDGIRYEIFRDNLIIAATNNTSFTDTTVTSGQSYSYTVRARDGGVNYSAFSNAVTGTATGTPGVDTQAPTVPANLRSTARTANSITLAWDAATDNVGVTAYEVYQGSSLVGTTSATGLVVGELTALTSYSFTVRARDAASNRSAASTALSVSTLAAPDTTAPNPPANLRSTGRSDSSVSLAWDVSSDPSGIAFYEIYAEATLVVTATGLTATASNLTPNQSYSFTVRAVDGAGNRSNASAALSVSTTDTTAPGVPSNLRSTGRSDTSIALAWNAASDAGSVRGYEVYAGSTLLTTTVNLQFAARGLTPSTSYSFTVRALDRAGNRSAASTALSVSTLAADGLPDDPALIAPPSDLTVVADLFADTAFLYTGPNPIQTGVAPGTITAQRVAVLRGRVLDRNNQPLAGVTIDVNNRPEFGQTLSRADGFFDLAVNGGGPLTLNYRRSGYLPAQRTLTPEWRNYAIAPDVVLVALDSALTNVTMGSSSMQIARGNAVTDADGTRRATVLFPAGTTASMLLPNGTTQPISTLGFRATEYTVGSNGPQAMPGPLPENSGYTYAVELSADQAIQANATEVRFNQPVIFYLENFVGFPVGLPVPSGYYDRQKAAWLPAPNGRVVRIISISSGLANLDTDGDGMVDNGTSLGVSNAERQQLATLYTAGQTLWRVPFDHFTPWDCNWPYGPPDDAEPPPPIPTILDCPDPCARQGSVIEAETQTMGQEMLIAGTPFSLIYRSDRVSGNANRRTLEIPVSGATVPASLRSIDVSINVAGRQITQRVTPGPNKNVTFTWDGKDVYGRTLQGSQPVRVEVAYTYPLVYRSPGTFQQSFGRFGDAPISGQRGAADIRVFSRSLPGTKVGTLDVRNQSNIGGWTLDGHHSYDPTNQTLFQGDGMLRGSGNDDVGSGGGVLNLNNSIRTVAGNGQYGSSGDNGAATAATLAYPQGIALGPDGSLYIADSSNNRIRRVNPQGIISTVAGTGSYGFSGDGGQATAAMLAYPSDIVVAADGSLYIADTGNNRIRRVAPNGVISTIAGTNGAGFSGDEGPATAAYLYNPTGLALSHDGSLYIADTYNNRIRRVGVDGRIVTIAGTPCFDSYFSCPLGDGGPAANAYIREPRGIAVAPDGSILVTSNYQRVRRIGIDGIISTIAGGGSLSNVSSGTAAIDAALYDLADVTVRPDGVVYLLANSRVWRLGLDGLLVAVAGGGSADPGDQGPATAAQLNSNGAVAVGPDGTLYITEQYRNRVRRVVSALPGFSNGEALIGAKHGNTIYRFDASGRHRATLDTLNPNTAQMSYSYDATGRLIAITDINGLTTRLERNADGRVTAIVGPYGHRTTFGYDTNGWLSQMTNPANETTAFSYTSDGLMTSMTNPRGGVSSYAYDTLGRLIRNTSPVGGVQTLSRTALPNGVSIRVTNPLSHTTEYRLENLPNGNRLRTVVAPNGTASTVLTKADGTMVMNLPDGTTTTNVVGPDPRFGMQSAYVLTQQVQNSSGTVFRTASSNRSATMSTPNNPLALQSLGDTVQANGRLTSSTFDASTRTLTSTDPSSAQTSVTFDSKMRPISHQLSSTAPVSYVYDSYGRVIEEREGTGTEQRVTRIEYDPRGNVRRITDPLGNITSFTYDAMGRMLSQTLPTGQTLTYSYDANGNPTSETNAQGIRTEYSYDLHNRMITSLLDPAGRAVRTTLSYDLANNLTRVIADEGTGRLNYTTTYSYTPLSPTTYVVSATTNPLNETVRMTYTPFGALRTVTDPLGRVTTYDYNDQGWLYRITSPENRVTTVEAFTDDGQPTRVRDARGSVTEYRYDASARLWQTIANTTAVGSFPAVNQTTTLEYDTLNRVRRITDPRGKISTIDYDSFGRIATETDALGNTTTYRYDALSRIVEKVVGGNVAAEALTVAYSYDAMGRLLTQRTDPNGLNLLTRYRYTRSGSSDTWNLQEVEDPRGNVTAYSYNSLGMLASVRDANGQTATYTYDNLMRMIEQRDPRGSLTTFTFDALNRMRTLTQSGRTERWDYNADGTLQQYIDFANRITSYSYDRDRLLTGINYPLGTDDVSMTYDATGNLSSVVDGLGTTTYSYDGLNRLRTRSRGTRSISYDYNPNNQITRIGYWGRGDVLYNYDDAGRLTSMSPWGAAATTYSYRSTGLLKSRITANGITTSYGYDSASRLTNMRHANGATTLLDISYVLDRNGNRERMTDSDGTTTYSYDALNRLTQVSYPAISGGPAASSTSYSYDAAGNRTSINSSTTFSYDTADRITNTGFSYDTNGNLLSNGSATFSYDAVNRLTRSVASGVTTDYAYDGNGNLTRETVGGATTEFIWDENQELPLLLGEIRADGTEVLYAHGPEGFATQRAVVGGTGQDPLYPLHDGLGSVRRLTGTGGTVLRSLSYDAFGSVRFSSGSSSSRLGYTGELMGQSDGTIYLRARHYLPTLGRFLQRDTFAGFTHRPQSLNRYVYAENCPISLVDPSGNCPESPLDRGVTAEDLLEVDLNSPAFRKAYNDKSDLYMAPHPNMAIDYLQRLDPNGNGRWVIVPVAYDWEAPGVGRQAALALNEHTALAIRVAHTQHEIYLNGRLVGVLQGNSRGVGLYRSATDVPEPSRARDRRIMPNRQYGTDLNELRDLINALYNDWRGRVPGDFICQDVTLGIENWLLRRNPRRGNNPFDFLDFAYDAQLIDRQDGRRQRVSIASGDLGILARSLARSGIGMGFRYQGGDDYRRSQNYRRCIMDRYYSRWQGLVR